MDIQLNDLAVFVRVADSGNFSRAADRFGTPSSTLSRRLAYLERQLGAPLFQRTTRQLTLTDFGRAYLARCRPIVEGIYAAHQHLSDMREVPSGRLRVSMPAGIGQLILPPVANEFLRQYPSIECEFDLSTKPVDPIENPYDIVLRLGEQPDSSLIGRRVAEFNCFLFATRTYLSAHGTPATVADLRRHACLRFSQNRHDSLWRLNRGRDTAAVEVGGPLSANNFGLLARFAAAGLGIAPIPVLNAVERQLDDADLVRVLPDWDFGTVPLIALVQSRDPPAKIRAFLDFFGPRLRRV
ncbi:LysR family transcriptional regulator [Achromobacter anxifer]